MLANDYAVVRDGLRCVLSGHRDIRVLGAAGAGMEQRTPVELEILRLVTDGQSNPQVAAGSPRSTQLSESVRICNFPLEVPQSALCLCHIKAGAKHNWPNCGT